MSVDDHYNTKLRWCVELHPWSDFHQNQSIKSLPLTPPHCFTLPLIQASNHDWVQLLKHTVHKPFYYRNDHIMMHHLSVQHANLLVSSLKL